VEVLAETGPFATLHPRPMGLALTMWNLPEIRSDREAKSGRRPDVRRFDR
jgi:hypothetical protein